MQAPDPYAELVPVPRAAIELPLPLPLPAGFNADDADTWPRVDGSLEFVGGRLLYMPPSSDLQQDTCTDVAGVLRDWRRMHHEYVVGTNEAGIRIGGETRGADAAVWRKSDTGGYRGERRRTPPLLAVEVAGKYDAEEALRQKADWYLSRGAAVVWLLFPSTLQVSVITGSTTVECGSGQRLPPHAALPDLTPLVDELFAQVSER